MKLILKAKNQKLGNIYILSGSKTTKEFRGVLVPSLKYHQIRDTIIHFPEAIQVWNAEQNAADTQKSSSLSTHNKIIKDYLELDLLIESESEIALSDANSSISILDKYDRTGLGNWYIEIIGQGLVVPDDFIEFDTYTIEWLPSSDPPNQIAIKKGVELVLQY